MYRSRKPSRATVNPAPSRIVAFVSSLLLALTLVAVPQVAGAADPATPEPSPSASEPSTPPSTSPSTPAPEVGVTPLASSTGVMALEGTGSISGTISASGGHTITAANPVNITLINAANYAWVNTVTTDDGNYTLSDIPAGTYYLQIHAAGDTLISEYYPNASIEFGAQHFTFTEAGESYTGINEVLDPASFISGRVTDSNGQGIADVYVYAYNEDQGLGNTNGSYTDATGNYQFGQLRASSYKVRFQAPSGLNYMSEFYDDVLDEADATLVQVGAAENKNNINAQLEEGSEISGTVTRADAAPYDFSSAEVYAISEVTGNYYYGTVSANGNYVVSGLAPDNYRIEVSPDPLSNLLSAYHGGTNWNSAQLVTITSGPAQQLTGKDVSVVLGSEISGTVTRADGEPWLADETPWVAAQRIDGSSLGWGTYANQDGTYTINALADGGYRVHFEPRQFMDELAEQWYNNAYSPAQAEVITVAGPQSITGIDAQLDEGTTTVSGTLTRADGQPWAAPVQLDLYFADTDDYAYTTFVNVSGNFTFTGVIPGSYYLLSYGDQTSVRGYYPGVLDLQDATTIIVGEEPVTGVDFQLQPGTSLSGTLTRTDGAQFANGEMIVYLFTADTYDSVSSAWVEPNGTYSIGQLPAGDYKVQFYKPWDSATNLIGGWWSNADGHYSAQVIAVDPATGPTTGIDQVIEVGGEITGTVTDAQGQPVEGIIISTQTASGSAGTSTSTDDLGNYTLRAVPVGDVTIRFEAYGEHAHMSEFWPNVHFAEQAQSIQVTTNGLVSGIDAQLEPASSISGTVTLPAGLSAAECQVHVSVSVVTPPAQSGADGGWGDLGPCADDSGAWSQYIHSPGEFYAVASYVGEETLGAQWSGNTVVREDAQIFHVSADSPQHFTGVDFTLDYAGEIPFTATRTDGGSINYIKVEAVRASDSKVIKWGWASEYWAGEGLLVGLPYDTYYLRASAAGLPSAYYGGADLASATPIIIDGTQFTENFEIELSRAAATKMVAITGGGETVTAGQTLSPLFVQAQDEQGNAASGAKVTFTVSGPATFPGGVTTFTATSNASGLVPAPAVTTQGEGTVVVNAVIVGVPASAVTFDSVTVLDPVSGVGTLDISSQAVTTVINGKIAVVVAVVNNGPAAVNLDLSGPLGSARTVGLAPGDSYERTFTTIRPSLAAGTVNITVTDPVGNFSADYAAAFEAGTR